MAKAIKGVGATHIFIDNVEIDLEEANKIAFEVAKKVDIDIKADIRWVPLTTDDHIVGFDPAISGRIHGRLELFIELLRGENVLKADFERILDLQPFPRTLPPSGISTLASIGVVVVYVGSVGFFERWVLSHPAWVDDYRAAEVATRLENEYADQDQ